VTTRAGDAVNWDPDAEVGRALVDEALAHAELARVELRELVQGILPRVLTRSELHGAVRALAERTPVPSSAVVGERSEQPPRRRPLTRGPHRPTQRWHELGPPPLGARDSRVVARPELQRRP
jgi:hypothetical protein